MEVAFASFASDLLSLVFWTFVYSLASMSVPSYASVLRLPAWGDGEHPDNARVQEAMQMEAGAVVRLKSGGPPMIVRAVSGDTAYCQWYAGVELHQGTFLFTSLEDISRKRRAAEAALHAAAQAQGLSA
jgi:uncharacterized protein YodC (DUF2158 family)